MTQRAIIIFLIIFGLSFLYAIIRYNLVRSVPLDNVPLFIANKAIALSATILIGFSFLLGPLARFWPNQFVPHLPLRKHLGVFGFALAALHAVMSLILLTPAYYPRFFSENGQLNFIGETSMLFGILAFLVFAGITVTSLPPMERYMNPAQWKFIQRLGYLAYVFVLLHVAIMGFRGWFRPESWQYGLASISLISALFIIFVLIMRTLVIVFPWKRI